jgi:hypothetical protein
VDLFSEVPRDTRGGAVGLATRRVMVALFCVFVALAVLDVYGQQAGSKAAVASTATVTVRAPDTVRGGLFFQSRVEIVARRAIEYPRIVLDRGWLEGMQVNSIEPAAQSESSRDGRLVLSYDTLDAGDRMTLWLQFEVDPTSVGRRPYGLELDDATTRLARVERTITVLP